MVVARQQTLVQLTDELLAALDQRAGSTGCSRSQVIREAVEAYLADELSDDIARRYREAYGRHPQEPDPWIEHLARESIAREPW